MNKKGLTLVELLIAITTLGIIIMALADFSMNTFKLSFDHSEALQKTSQSRLFADLISTEINRAAYIFPGSHEVEITNDEGGTVTVNTDEALALLVKNKNSDSYKLKVFYLIEGEDNKVNLNEFTSSNWRNWTFNTHPIDYFSGISGSSSTIATNIIKSETSLNYILNYNNGINDPNLKGTLGGANVNDSNALIKGITWDLTIQSKSPKHIKAGGVSKNVPRFIDH